MGRGCLPEFESTEAGATRKALLPICSSQGEAHLFLPSAQNPRVYPSLSYQSPSGPNHLAICAAHASAIVSMAATQILHLPNIPSRCCCQEKEESIFWHTFGFPSLSPQPLPRSSRPPSAQPAFPRAAALGGRVQARAGTSPSAEQHRGSLSTTRIGICTTPLHQLNASHSPLLVSDNSLMNHELSAACAAIARVPFPCRSFCITGRGRGPA